MATNRLEKIDSRYLAFDIDGVVADIMSTFISVAHERYKSGICAMTISSNLIWSTASEWMKTWFGKYWTCC